MEIKQLLTQAPTQTTVVALSPAGL